MLSHSQVGVFYEHLGFAGILKAGVYFGHEPSERVVVAVYGSVVGAEDVYAIVFEIPFRQFYVAEQALPGVLRGVGAA